MRFVVALLTFFSVCRCEAIYNFSVRERYVDVRTPAHGELDRDRPGGGFRFTDPFSPDNPFMRAMNLVNNSFPGPTIEITEGEQLVVHLHNDIDSEFTDLHWHGITQWGTFFHDGAYSFNTCGVAPHDTRRYSFKAEPCGTRFYHGHTSYQFARGLAGPLIIHCLDDPYQRSYDEERILTVFDSWKQVDENVEYFNPTAPKFLLVNGLYGDGSSELPFVEIPVRASQCYRFRIISLITLGWDIQMTTHGHTFQVISLNGHLLRSPATGISSVVMTTAERMDFILCASANVGRYKIDFARYDTIPPMSTGAILAYDGSSAATLTANANLGGVYHTYVEIINAKPYKSASSETLLPTSSLSFEMGGDFPENSAAYFRQNGHLPEIKGKTVMKIGHPWTNDGPPLVARCADLPAQADPIYTFHEITVVDILFRNLFSVDHAIHLHGHDMYIVDRGSFVDPATGQTSIVNPVSRPTLESLGNLTVLQYCASTGVLNHPDVMPEMYELRHQVRLVHGFLLATVCEQWSCDTDVSRYRNIPLDTAENFPTDLVWIQARGWIVGRVKLNNPGIWPFHCHQQQHVLVGMATALDVLPDRQPEVPKELLKNCKCDVADKDDDAVVWVFVVLACIASVVAILSVRTLRNARDHAAELEVKIQKLESGTHSIATPHQQYGNGGQPWGIADPPGNRNSSGIGEWKL